MEGRKVVTTFKIKGMHKLHLKIKKADRLIAELIKTIEEVKALSPK